MLESYRDLTDEQLIAALKNSGDPDGKIMDYILDKYKPLVRKKANAVFLIGGETDDLIQEGMIGLKDGEDRKTLIAVIALVAAVLIAVTAGVVYLLKTRMDDEYEEDWDYDWDDLDDEFCEDDECCCTDKDVDDSVKVEQA